MMRVNIKFVPCLLIGRDDMRSCSIAKLCLVVSLLAVGCSGPDYPQVVYPPKNPRFNSPDLRIAVSDVSLVDGSQLTLDAIHLPRPSAEVVVTGSISHAIPPEELAKRTIGVMFLNARGHPMSLGLTFPQIRENQRPTFEVHLLGPARPGSCRFVVRVLNADSKENRDFVSAQVTVSPAPKK